MYGDSPFFFCSYFFFHFGASVSFFFYLVLLHINLKLGIVFFLVGLVLATCDIKKYI